MKRELIVEIDDIQTGKWDKRIAMKFNEETGTVGLDPATDVSGAPASFNFIPWINRKYRYSKRALA